MSAIDDLVSATEKLMVLPVAHNHEEAERMSSDFREYIRERMSRVPPLPDALAPLLESAIDEWHRREREFYDVCGFTAEEFLEQGGSAISNHKPGPMPLNIESIKTEQKERLVGEQNARLHMVRNIDWVHLFCWILPRADAKHAAKYCAIGRAMAIIMFCEARIKWREEIEKFRILYSIATEAG